MISGESRNSNDNRVKEISDITRGLKAIAKELNIPVVALSQLSRKVEEREKKTATSRFKRIWFNRTRC